MELNINIDYKIYLFCYIISYDEMFLFISKLYCGHISLFCHLFIDIIIISSLLLRCHEQSSCTWQRDMLGAGVIGHSLNVMEILDSCQRNRKKAKLLKLNVYAKTRFDSVPFII